MPGAAVNLEFAAVSMPRVSTGDSPGYVPCERDAACSSSSVTGSSGST